MKTMTTKQLAERWNLNQGTLRTWRCKGKGPAYLKLGDSPQADVVYEVNTVEVWEKKHRHESSSTKHILRKRRK